MLYVVRVFLLLVVVASTTTIRAQLAHDVRIDSMFWPWKDAVVAPGVHIRMPFRFMNAGSSYENRVTIIAVIQDHKKVVQYQDTIILNNWSSGQTKDTAFKEFIPVPYSGNYCTVFSTLSTDQARLNDTLRTSFYSAYPYDMFADSVLFPTQVVQKIGFQPKGEFIAAVLNEYRNVPVRVQIRDCVTGKLAFSADTIIPEIHIESPKVTVSFPMREGIYDTRKLDSGCYTIGMIARWPVDGDRTNDTAYSTFTVIPNMYGNDVEVDKILSPDVDRGLPFQPNFTVPVIVRFINAGKNFQPSTTVRVRIVDRKGVTLDDDSAHILNWRSGDTNVVTFYSFTPRALGTYNIIAEAILPTDEAPLDNILSGALYCGQHHNFELVELLSPKDSTVISDRDTFRISGSFRWMAAEESSPAVTVHALIEDSMGNSVWGGSLDVGPVSLDSGLVYVTIPSDSAPLRGLPPGRYTVGLFASNGAGVSLTVKQRYNIVLDSIRPQYFDDTIFTAPPVFTVYATNQGTRTLAESQTKLELWDSTHPISKWISTQKDWMSGESRRIDFSPVPLLRTGSYQALVYAPDDSEQTHFPAHLTSSFFYLDRSTLAVSEAQTVSSDDAMIEVFDLLGRQVFVGFASERPSLAPGPYIERRTGAIRKVVVQ
jgi:hypothetical protein